MSSQQLSALYYPYPTPQSVDKLKKALLVFDHIYFIVPAAMEGEWYSSEDGWYSIGIERGPFTTGCGFYPPGALPLGRTLGDAVNADVFRIVRPAETVSEFSESIRQALKEDIAHQQLAFESRSQPDWLILENRGTHKFMGADSPFYSAHKIGKYTFAPYKVVWKEISGKISGRGQFIVAVVRPSYSYKKIMPIIPDHKLIFIPLENEEEAYFVCGILSCSAVRLVVAGYTIENEIPTNIPRYIKIPKFVVSDVLHTGLANLCKKAHSLTEAFEKLELEQIQSELDRLAGKVYNLSNSETQMFRESLDRLND
jgi:hypothetical protein